MKVKIKRFDKEMPLPVQKSKTPAAWDFYCREEVEIAPGEMKGIHLNCAMEIPVGTVMLFVVRSSTPFKKGLVAPHSVGVLDPFFSGDKDELFFPLMNVTDKPVKVSKGDRLVQAFLVKTENIEWEEVDKLTNPGAGGYVVQKRQES